MKKLLITLFIIIIFFYAFMFVKDEKVISTMNYLETNEIDDVYFLDFSNENLTTKNFKLKIAPFTGYAYKVNKIYPKFYIDKEYYSYDFNNIDLDIEKFTEEYISDLKRNFNYDEIDKVKTDGIKIVGVELYAQKDALTKFNKKYPNVKYYNVRSNM